MKGVESLPVRWIALLVLAAVILLAMAQAASTLAGVTGSFTQTFNQSLGQIAGMP